MDRIFPGLSDHNILLVINYICMNYKPNTLFSSHLFKVIAFSPKIIEKVIVLRWNYPKTIYTATEIEVKLSIVQFWKHIFHIGLRVQMLIYIILFTSTRIRNSICSKFEVMKNSAITFLKKSSWNSGMKKLSISRKKMTNSSGYS